MDVCYAAEIERFSAERGIHVADVESYAHLRPRQTDFDLERLRVFTHKVNEMVAPPPTENDREDTLAQSQELCNNARLMNAVAEHQAEKFKDFATKRRPLRLPPVRVLGSKGLGLGLRGRQTRDHRQSSSLHRQRLSRQPLRPRRRKR